MHSGSSPAVITEACYVGSSKRMDPVGWETIEYAVAAISDVRAIALTLALEGAYSNGRVILVRFVPTDAAAFDWASRYDFRGREHQLRSFLLAVSTCPELLEMDIAECDPMPPQHHTISAFELEGALTHTLMVGGAYGGAVSEAIARELSRSFVDSCFEERRLTATVFALRGAWSSWFFDIAWEGSFIAYDPVGKAWTCLFFTDTD